MIMIKILQMFKIYLKNLDFDEFLFKNPNKKS
jgi:hypothetical protein